MTNACSKCGSLKKTRETFKNSCANFKDLGSGAAPGRRTMTRTFMSCSNCGTLMSTFRHWM